MGIFGSSEEEVEIKTVDTTGNVNNNIIIQEARDTHTQMIIGEKLLFATYLLVAAECIKLAVYAFQSCRKMFKKRYQGSS